MPHELSCIGVNSDGTPCGTPSRFVNEQSGYCRSHDPDKRDQVRRDARRGGEATARRFKDGRLDPDALGPLESVEDCRRWCQVIGQAVASGQLGHKEAAAAIRASEAAAKVLATASREEIADLRTELQRVRKVKAVR